MLKSRERFLSYLQAFLRKHSDKVKSASVDLTENDKKSFVISKQAFYLGQGLKYECQESDCGPGIETSLSFSDGMDQLFVYHSSPFDEDGGYVYLEIMGVIIIDTEKKFFNEYIFDKTLERLFNVYPVCICDF